MARRRECNRENTGNFDAAEPVDEAAGYLGFTIYRSTEMMEQALADLKEVREKDIPRMVPADDSLAFNQEWKAAIENYNLLDCAEVSIKASLMREETRAAERHERGDNPPSGYHRGALAGLSPEERAAAIDAYRTETLSAALPSTEPTLARRSFTLDHLKELAIRRKPRLSLRAALEEKTRQELLDYLCIDPATSELGSLKKPALINSMLAVMVGDGTRCAEMACICSDAHYRTLRTLVERGGTLWFSDDEVLQNSAHKPMPPYVNLYHYQGAFTYVIPSEYLAAFELLDWAAIERQRVQVAAAVHSAEVLTAQRGLALPEDAYACYIAWSQPDEKNAAGDKAPAGETSSRADDQTPGPATEPPAPLAYDDYLNVLKDAIEYRPSCYEFLMMDGVRYLVEATIIDQYVDPSCFAGSPFFDHEPTTANNTNNATGANGADSANDTNGARNAVVSAFADLLDYLHDLLKHRRFIPPCPVDDALRDTDYTSWELQLPAAVRLRDYLDAHVPDDEDDYRYADTLLEELLVQMGGDPDITGTIEYLADYEVAADYVELETILPLATDLVNSIPNWGNNGWSPYEMYQRGMA